MIARPALLLVLTLAGCESSTLESTAPETYYLKVVVHTTGAGVDVDGYSLSVDGVVYRVDAQDTLRFGRFSQGESEIQLSGLSPGCRLPAPPAPPSLFSLPPADEAWQETRHVAVVGHDTETSFQVTCYETGSLALTVQAPDGNTADKYRVRLNHHPVVFTVQAGGTVTIPWVSEGTHRVSAQGAPSCFPGRTTTLNVAVQVGSTSVDTLRAGVACIAP